MPLRSRPAATCGLLAFSLLVSACEARFVDLRDPSLRPAPAPDLAGVDLAGADLAGLDLATPAEKTLARGTFEGRAGHGGDGTAELHRYADGRLEVRMLADFRTSAVPGPKVVLTSRADMGTRIDPQTDLELAGLTSPNGPQAYPVPGPDTGRRNVFVFCKPFSVEVAKAALKDLP